MLMGMRRGALGSSYLKKSAGLMQGDAQHWRSAVHWCIRVSILSKHVVGELVALALHQVDKLQPSEQGPTSVEFQELRVGRRQLAFEH